MAWTERYVRADAVGTGDGTNDTTNAVTGAWTLLQAINTSTGAQPGHRVNVRAGSYTGLAAATLTFAKAGTTTQPIWWRGFKSAAGDLDDATDDETANLVAGTDYPTWAAAAAASFTMSGNYHEFSHIDMTGASPGTRLVGGAAAHTRFTKCSVDCTENASTSYAMRLSGNGFVVSKCRIKAHTGVNIVVVLEERGEFYANTVIGGSIGVQADGGAQSIPIEKNCFRGQLGDGILVVGNGSGQIHITKNTINAPGGDCIQINTTAPASGLISDNVFVSPGSTVAINNQTGSPTATNNIARMNNSYYPSSTTDSNFGDAPNYCRIDETSSPVTSSTDCTLVAGALSIQAAAPGRFLGETPTTKEDRGAVGYAAAAGGGGGGSLVGPGRLVR